MTLPSEPDQHEAAMLLSHPLHFPDEFKSWLLDYVQTNIPLIPFSHIFGARHNIARSGVSITASESGAPTASYGDVTTVGPSITGIADGTYLIVWGAQCRDKASISINGASAVDADAVYGQEYAPNAFRQKISSLSNNNNNSIVMKYKGSNAFSQRWIVVFRLGAP